MNAKEFMIAARGIDDKIRGKVRQYRNWQELSLDLGEMDSPVYKFYAEMACDKIDKEINYLLQLKYDAENAVLQLRDTDEQKVLRLRYFENLPWEIVGDEFGRGGDLPYAKVCHTRALKYLVVPEKYR